VSRIGVKAIVLAAGEGSRLRPYTDDRPKCLVELGGRTLLDWQLQALRACRIPDIVVITGYRAGQVTPAGVRTRVNPRFRETNMVHTLWCAEAELTGEVVVAYADILYEPRLVLALLAEPHDLSVVVDRRWEPYWRARFGDPLEDAETLRIDPGGRILKIGQVPRGLDEIDGRYVGLLRFKGAGLEALKSFYGAAAALAARGGDPWGLPRPFENAYMTDLLQALIVAGHRVQAVPTEGGWLEIDTARDYELARAGFTDGTIREFFDPGAIPG
jgi:choline kinase